ncbi:hypothetical protein DPEC_G00082880 [Dallia pectoralis]|uniref:Uncharacterized protein n=1 Tax=Dallia pectoralis TaxID=75939 RepID=A0ACC2GZA1_DALPE|nr:hypothetical protein DPEC_G00082880 [Dallia pectoralis]
MASVLHLNALHSCHFVPVVLTASYNAFAMVSSSFVTKSFQGEVTVDSRCRNDRSQPDMGSCPLLPECMLSTAAHSELISCFRPLMWNQQLDHRTDVSIRDRRKQQSVSGTESFRANR